MVKAMMVVSVFSILLVLFAGTLAARSTQLRDQDAEATINALQTEAAQLKTQVATLSPTPMTTRAPLPTVAAEPMLLTDGLELLYYYAIPDGSETIIFGEVRNITETVIGSPHFELALLDAEGNIVGIANGSPSLVTAGPGEMIPFEARVDIARDEWYQATITACEWGTEYYVEQGFGPSPTLQLQDVVEVEKSAERLVIEGEVLNSGDTPAEPVQVKALVYLADGRYAGHAWTSIDVPIPAGKTARFELDGWSYNVTVFGSAEASDDYTYQLWVGTEQGAKVYSC